MRENASVTHYVHYDLCANPLTETNWANARGQLVLGDTHMIQSSTFTSVDAHRMLERVFVSGHVAVHVVCNFFPMSSPCVLLHPRSKLSPVHSGLFRILPLLFLDNSEDTICRKQSLGATKLGLRA